MKFTKKSIYISLFGILYLIVAFSSFFHAVSFFGLANNSWMSIILALAFEIGQAAVLFSLLTSKRDRSRIMPWVLMTMFTLVQVIGNVYSSYKYIITNSSDNLRYFKEPIFIWTDLPDDQATVIIVYLVGALLPIAALLLTSMITNYLTDTDLETNESEEEIKDDKYEELRKEIDKLKRDSIWSMEEDDIEDEIDDTLDGPPEGEGRSDEQEIKDLNILLDDKDKEIERLRQELEKKNEQEKSDNDTGEQPMETTGSEEISKIPNDTDTDIIETNNKSSDVDKQKEIVETELEGNRSGDDSGNEYNENNGIDNPVEQEKIVKPSHFINLK